MPPWSQKLRNLYWFLRYKRVWDSAARRKYYRWIEKEKRRLEEVGVDQEEIRLLCRHLANPKNTNAEQRWMAYVAQMQLFEK